MTQKKVNLQRIANDKTRITTFKKRKANVYKKADEFTTLCGVETCLIVYGPTKATDEVVVEPEIWPRDENKVRDIIRKYIDTMSNSCKKEDHVETYVNDLGKAKEMEGNKRVLKSTQKYCSWEDKLDKCSRDQLRGILYAVNNKLHDGVKRQERNMIRVHHQAIDTQIPLNLMDQHYMPQFQEQPQFQSSILPYNNMGFSLISPHNNQIQMDPNIIENWNDFALTQSLMISKGNDSTQLSQWQAQQYYNHQEPVVQRSAGFKVNPYAGYDVPLGILWRFSGNQVEEWKPI